MESVEREGVVAQDNGGAVQDVYTAMIQSALTEGTDMTPGDNPSFYSDKVTMTITIPLSVAAKLATYRREMHPTYTDEQVAAYLIRDSLVGLGLLPLPTENRGKAAGGTK